MALPGVSLLCTYLCGMTDAPGPGTRIGQSTERAVTHGQAAQGPATPGSEVAWVGDRGAVAKGQRIEGRPEKHREGCVCGFWHREPESGKGHSRVPGQCGPVAGLGCVDCPLKALARTGGGRPELQTAELAPLGKPTLAGASRGRIKGSPEVVEQPGPCLLPGPGLFPFPGCPTERGAEPASLGRTNSWFPKRPRSWVCLLCSCH